MIYYICSPYRANTPEQKAKHIQYAKDLARWQLLNGYSVIVPHLCVAECLNDDDQQERNIGIEVDLELMKKCDVIIVGMRYGVSDGMKTEIYHAEKLKIPVVYVDCETEGGADLMAQEKNFEEKVKKYLKENGCWFLKYWGGGGFTKSGIPDLLVCCKGWFMGVEIKGPDGKPSDLQIYNLRKIDSAGGRGILLYPKDFDLFKRLVEDPGNQKLYEVLKSKWKHFENIIKKGE